MARTVDEIYQSIIEQKQSYEELSALDSTSKVAIHLLWAYITAVVIWSLEVLFDAHKAAVDSKISAEKVHSLKWYQNLAKLFQYGQSVNQETGTYDNVGLSDTQISAQQIVKYSAVTEKPLGGLLVKIAREVDSELAPLSNEQITAFESYINKVKDAGVDITVQSRVADSLQLEIDIWYNPQVFRSDGSRIDGYVSEPVKTAINNYLRNLPFNGEYANTRLADYLQKVDGVELVTIKASRAKYGLHPFTAIDERYLPDAGYLRISDGDLSINYREYVQY